MVAGGANAEAVATTAASRMAQRYMVMVVFFDCSYDVRAFMPLLLMSMLLFGNPFNHSSSDLREKPAAASAAGADRYLGPNSILSHLFPFFSIESSDVTSASDSHSHFFKHKHDNNLDSPHKTTRAQWHPSSSLARPYP